MKVAVVSGVSSGIGHEITELLLNHGIKVYGISRDKPDFKNKSFVWLECDLLIEESITSCLHNITEAKVDLLVCNAGTSFKQAAKDVTKQYFDDIFNLNVLAPMLIVRQLYGKITKSTIINISSLWDRLQEKDYSLYGSSKAASTHYFENLAVELTDSKVYSLLPSYVDTPLSRRHVEVTHFPWDKILQPRQIAELAYKLFGQEFKISSGSNIIVVNSGLLESHKITDSTYTYNVDTQRLNTTSIWKIPLPEQN